MAKQLTFDKNLVEYEINGDFTVSFNPADEEFAAKLEDMFYSLEGLQERLAGEKSFSKFRELDAEMRQKIDGLLGDGASDALFPDMNCFAIANGLPVWMNLAMALYDEVTEAYAREFGKTDARFEAHKAKHDKMMLKYRAKGKK